MVLEGPVPTNTVLLVLLTEITVLLETPVLNDTPVPVGPAETVLLVPFP